MTISTRVSALFLAALFAATSAQAATPPASGTIKQVQINYTSGGDYLQLNGVGALGACPAMFGVGMFAIRNDSRGNRQLALLTAAWVSGKTVSISVDDAAARDANGFCYLRYVSVTP